MGLAQFQTPQCPEGHTVPGSCLREVVPDAPGSEPSPVEALLIHLGYQVISRLPSLLRKAGPAAISLIFRDLP